MIVECITRYIRMTHDLVNKALAEYVIGSYSKWQLEKKNTPLLPFPARHRSQATPFAFSESKLLTLSTASMDLFELF
jgi:hypothetical protein